jgi:hypothetical protein
MEMMLRKMKILLLLLCLILFCTYESFSHPVEKKERILIILDASAGMQKQWQDSLTRFKAASTFIMQLMDSVYARNNEVEFAMRVYGHQYPAGQSNCYDTRLEVMYSMDNYTQMGLRLASLHTIGVTPVSFTINEAVDYDMADADRYNYHLVIVTDGAESCGGNLCDIAKKLADKHIPIPCIISLAGDAVLREQYSCIGNYQAIIKRADISTAIHDMINGCCNIPYLIKYNAVVNDAPVTKKAKVLYEYKSIKRDPAKSIIDSSLTRLNTPSFVTTPKRASAIVTSTKKGYLKLINTNGVGKVTLYYFTNGAYALYSNRQISAGNADQRLTLQEGKYKIIYDNNGNYKEFKISPDMITEVRL